MDVVELTATVILTSLIMLAPLAWMALRLRQLSGLESHADKVAALDEKLDELIIKQNEVAATVSRHQTLLQQNDASPFTKESFDLYSALLTEEDLA